jgi:hypothetical protein
MKVAKKHGLNMDNDEKRKRLERQARSLILTREISPDDRDRINFLMRDQAISHEERYTSIIRILKRAPEKEITEIQDDNEKPDTPVKKRNAGLKKSASVKSDRTLPEILSGMRKYPDINGPTETKLYINDIYIKYRKYRLFRKRYLARRNNRLGIGFSKRLIPTKKFLILMGESRTFQETILSRLPQILEAILKDETIETPLEFNYLRELRRWMIVSPFSTVPYDRIRWMEQWDFERELKMYTVYYNSFLRLESEHREMVLAMAEKFLRMESDLLKEEILEGDDRATVVMKENENYRKEKFIFEYLGAMRSFLALHGEADSLLASFLKKKYNIPMLEELLNMTLEALVFQRPFTGTELREYFGIKPVSVSNELWDLNITKLKLYGKDPESKRRKLAVKLKKELFWYETVYQLVRLDENGRNLLVSSADEQWKRVDRLNRDGKEYMKNNIVIFLEGIINYFRNLVVPLIDGRPLSLDVNGKTVEAPVFSRDFFSEELREIEVLASDIYAFRNLNPTLKISEEEMRKILARKISSMDHVGNIIFKTGSLFYSTARKLHEVFCNHIKAQDGCDMRSGPLVPDDINTETVIPYSSCVFKGFDPPTLLVKRISGRKIINENMKSGIIIFIMAYCYQTALLCGYPQIQNDLAKRESIRKQIQELQGEPDDAQK